MKTAIAEGAFVFIFCHNVGLKAKSRTSSSTGTVQKPYICRNFSAINHTPIKTQMTFRKTAPALVGLAAFCIQAAPAQTADTVDVDLDQCIAIALDKSPVIKVADLEITRTDWSRKEVLGQLLPSVSFGGTYNRMLAKQVTYMNMSAFKMPGMSGDTDQSRQPDQDAAETPKKDNGIKMGLDNSFQLGFQASVPLVAPQLWQSLKLSDAQIAQSLEQSRASRINLVNSIKNAYYAYLLALHTRIVTGQSYDMAATTHKAYKGQFDEGAASEFDVLRTEVAMKNIEPQITQADIAISRARLQLFVLMGLPIDTPIRFTGTLEQYEKTMYDDIMALGNDWQNNTSLVQNKLQTKTLQQALKVQQMAWYPTLSLSANYNWTSSSDGSPFKNFRWNPYSVVGLTLNFPIFQGGQRYSRIRQAQVQLTQALLQRQDIENTVQMQISVARDNIALNAKQIGSCRESIRQAEKAHSIMQESFDIGAASYLDLRDAELALTQTRLSYYQSVYNYLLGGAELQLLLGQAFPAGQDAR